MKNNMKRFGLLLVIACLFRPFPCLAAELIDEASSPTEAGMKPGSVLGAGVLYSARAYKGVASAINPIPLAVLQYKRFYIDKDILGYYLVDGRHFQFSIAGGPNLAGYHSSDSPDLAGMEDRDGSADAGLRFRWRNDIVNFTITGLSDILGISSGQRVVAFLSKPFVKGALTPRIGAEWSSDKLVNYYYGVRDSEAIAGRPAYSPNQTINYFGGLRFGVPLGARWALVGDVQYTLLGDEIQDSPIVNKKFLMRYAGGVVYRF